MDRTTCECGGVLIPCFWGVPTICGCVQCGNVYDNDGNFLYTASEIEAQDED